METSLLGLSVPSSLNHCTFSDCICFHLLQDTDSLMMGRKVLAFDYIRVSLGVILLLCSFSRTVEFDVSLPPLFLWSQILGHPRNVRKWFYVRDETYIKSIINWLFPQCSATVSPVYLEDRSPYRRVCSWVICLSPLVPYRVFFQYDELQSIGLRVGSSTTSPHSMSCTVLHPNLLLYT